MKTLGLAVAGSMIFLASGAVAQDQETFVMGMYYRCNQARESQADDVMQNVMGPIVQRHVDAGHLTGWAWFTHVMGGGWRRLFVTTGTDLGQMMNVRGQIVEEFTGQHADAAETLGSACGGHDDYIWVGEQISSADPGTLGSATFSTYYACDGASEGRASEIFEELLAPLYQKHQDAGHLASWGFYRHRSGGRFRRLETMSGADHMTLLNMQQAIYQEAQDIDPFAFREFRSICNWHTDYMWNNTNAQ